MKWLFSNDAPIYTQLIEQIKVGIVAGAFPPGERLPSVRDLATEAGVNPNTMQRALAELERDGLVFSQRTAGRFVTEDKTMIEQAKKELLKIYGVGTKVADCVLLFGMRFYSCCPLDVWMKRVMEYYPDGFPKCFEGIEGIAQQYLFHWARNNL